MALLAVAGCGHADERKVGTNQVAATVPAPGAGPDAKTPLGPTSPGPAGLRETKQTIDPKSVEAAAEIVQHYGALIEQKRWTESRQYWTDPAAAKAFERNFRNDADVHIEIGEPGELGGAAGSIYVTEPVTFYGKTNGGGDYRRTANTTLRRVNDVPGSTEAQRRWHIERIEMQPL